MSYEVGETKLLWTYAERKALYKECFDVWGHQAQVDMLVEELGECIVAVQKLFKRDYSLKRVKDLASEIADVKIMIEEIELLLDEVAKKPADAEGTDYTFKELVAAEFVFKLDRTQSRINKVKGAL